MSFNISLGGSGSAVQIGGFASGNSSGNVGFAVPGAQVAFGSGGVAPPFGMVVQVGGAAPVPPLQFGGIYGYEALPADPKATMVVPAPTYLPQVPPEPAAAATPAKFPAMNTEAVREALRAFCKKHITYSQDVANTATFSEIKPVTVNRVQLETFIERRTAQWAVESFAGGAPVDGPEYGQAPPLWYVPVATADVAPFTAKTAAIEVPHTATARPCFDCQAQGQIRCTDCQGQGQIECKSCNARGSKGACFFCKGAGGDCIHCRGTGKDRCLPCEGKGRTDCKTCSKKGMVTCKQCKGTRFVKIFIRCNVTWETLTDTYQTQVVGVPPKEMTKAKGKAVLADERTIVTVPEDCGQQVQKAATDLITKHHNPATAPDGRVLRQRLRVTAIPATQVSATYKGKAFTASIFGVDNTVLAQNFPSRLGGCTVM